MEELLIKIEEIFKREIKELRAEFKQENEKLRAEFKQENKKLRVELRSEFKQENIKLKNELKNELKIELKDELKFELGEELKKQLLDNMFVFEENYGRKINIMFEELMSKNQKDRVLEEDFLILEKRVDKNSAFVSNHEKRIATLEEAKR